MLGLNLHDMQAWVRRYGELQLEIPSVVTTFARKQLHQCSGSTVSLKDFYEAYVAHCQAHDHLPESMVSVSRTMRSTYAIGKGRGNQNYIANVTMDTNSKIGEPLVLTDKGRLRRMLRAA